MLSLISTFACATADIYDFGTELFEFNFDEDMGAGRRAMVLNIPRGMMFTLRVGLSR